MKKFKFLFLVTGLMAISSCTKDNSKPGYRFLINDMAQPVPYEAFSENPLTKDGKTMQLKAPGTIARGNMPFTYGVPGTEFDEYDEAIRAGEEVTDPRAPSDKRLARGKYLYENFCLICHGEKGLADGPLIPKFPSPPPFSSRKVSRYSEGRIFYVITRGYGNMPSHSAQLKAEDRWDIIQYVKTLQVRRR